MKNRTTIQIERETLKKLIKAKKQAKFGKRTIEETHDELLNRLLKSDTFLNAKTSKEKEMKLRKLLMEGKKY